MSKTKNVFFKCRDFPFAVLGKRKLVSEKHMGKTYKHYEYVVEQPDGTSRSYTQAQVCQCSPVFILRGVLLSTAYWGNKNRGKYYEGKRTCEEC
jgi:hypothetical protein